MTGPGLCIWPWLKYLEKVKGIPVRPRYSFKRKPRGDGETFDVTDVECPATAAGYRLFKQREIAADLKVRCAHLHHASCIMPATSSTA